MKTAFACKLRLDRSYHCCRRAEEQSSSPSRRPPIATSFNSHHNPHHTYRYLMREALKAVCGRVASRTSSLVTTARHPSLIAQLRLFYPYLLVEPPTTPRVRAHAPTPISINRDCQQFGALLASHNACPRSNRVGDRARESTRPTCSQPHVVSFMCVVCVRACLRACVCACVRAWARPRIICCCGAVLRLSHALDIASSVSPALHTPVSKLLSCTHRHTDTRHSNQPPPPK